MPVSEQTNVCLFWLIIELVVLVHHRVRCFGLSLCSLFWFITVFVVFFFITVFVVLVLSYLRKYDILGLLESWVVDQSLINQILTEYDCCFCSAMKRSNLGRPMARVVVYVRKTIIKYVKRICEDTSFGIFLSIDYFISYY